MDNPLSAVLLLETLPSDLWACIASYLPGEHIGRLKLTGAKSLWHRIACSKVVKAVIIRNVARRFKSWPAFLNELSSVEELLFNLSSNPDTANFSPKLSLLPPTLRKLAIFGDLVKMRNFFVDDEYNDLNLDELVPHIEVLDLRTKRMDSFSWMARIPQSLTTLHLYSWASDQELPISLINLKITYELIFRPPEGLKLPPNLERISAFSISGMKLLIPLLPRSFLQLEVSSTFPVAKYLPDLPQSLTSLSSISFNLSEATPDNIVLLPPALTTLKIGAVLPSSCWHLLPPNLTKLYMIVSVSSCATSFKEISCPVTGASKDIPIYPIGLLPKSITFLSISLSVEMETVQFYLDPPSDSLPPQFPPHLAELTTSLQLPPNAVKHLPNSLTRLTIPELSEGVCKELPRGLVSLDAHAVLMSPNLLQFLPKTLNFLRLRREDASDTCFNHHTFDYERMFTGSPPCPVHESDGSNIQWANHSLPVNLIKLELDNFADIGDEFAKQNLTNLMELDLCSATKISDLAIPLLGRHLSTLNLAHAHDVTGKCFPQLPRHLTMLDLSSSHAIFDSDIQHLPTNLVSIKFKSAIHLTDMCVKDFPRNAETIILRKNRLITTSSMPSMPILIREYYRQCVVSTATWNLRLGILSSEENT